jgi:hypothetical protein
VVGEVEIVLDQVDQVVVVPLLEPPESLVQMDLAVAEELAT